MTFQIERVRTAILVRNSKGFYRIVYFAHMPHERAHELLHEYGLDDGEVLSIETVGIRQPLEISDEQVVSLLRTAFTSRLFAAGGALRRETVLDWVTSTLQGMLSHGYRLCPPTEKQQKELYTVVNSIRDEQ